jgi:hypothetical protein
MKENKIKVDCKSRKLLPEHWDAIAKAESKNFSVFIEKGKGSHEFRADNYHLNEDEQSETGIPISEK